jgi:type III secretory pathway component EscU
MKLDLTDILFLTVGIILAGAVAGMIGLFNHYCKVLGTPLTILVSLIFFTTLLLVGFIDYLIQKYHK